MKIQTERKAMAEQRRKYHAFYVKQTLTKSNTKYHQQIGTPLKLLVGWGLTTGPSFKGHMPVYIIYTHTPLECLLVGV